MSEFTVTVELIGCSIGGAEYLRLDDLMEIEGFKRRVSPLAGRIHPANLLTHPDNLPHASYFGRSGHDESTLRRHLETEIMRVVHSEIAVSVTEASASAE
jgi:hypothetical protein